MVEMTRMNLRVSEDIPGMLADLAGARNKMGDYLETIIRQLHAGQASVGSPGEIELLTGAVRHLSAKVKEIDGRLLQVEEEIAM